MEDPPSREELRRRLRAKINGKRSTTDMARSIKKDPQTALMSMGVDDADILSHAKEIAKNPHQTLHQLKSTLKELEEGDARASTHAAAEAIPAADSDDDEAPPPLPA